MRLDHLRHHLDRRAFLAGVASTAATTVLVPASAAGASTRAGGPGADVPDGPYDDEFSIEGALNGDWAKATAARYGADDQRGTLNEITPRTTARAMRLLDGASHVVTYNLGHLMVNKIPGYITFPPRKYEQRVTVLGYQPDNADDFFSTTTTGVAGEDEWRAADRARGPLGYLQSPSPAGPNMVSGHEERFPEGATYQLATQMDNLNHIGVGSIFYNGYRMNEHVSAAGTLKLGMEHVGPFVTRGIVVDVLGWKIAKQGGADTQVIGGNQMLDDSYRITLDDICDTMKWERVADVQPGDVVLIRTGWHHLAEDPDTYSHYLATEPGIFLREAKFFADRRPALVGADTWALEVIGAPASEVGPWAFPVHQELLPKHGIRIGEGVITDGLAADGVHDFVYMYSPQYAAGATAGNVPPVGLAKGR